MIRLTRAQVQPIGLDIGHDSVKLMQVEIGGDGETLAVTAAARALLPEEARRQPELRMPAAVGIVRQLLRQNPFVGRRVVAALPREVMQIKNLRLPLMPSSELDSAVQLEAQHLFGHSAEQMQVHWLPAGEVRQGMDVRQEVIVLGVRHEAVEDYLEYLHRCGVVVESLDVEACALFRSMERFTRRQEDEQEVQVLVDVGARRSQVVIGKNRDISFYKAIEMGGQHLHEAVSRKLGITPEEAQTLRRRLAEGGAAAREGQRDPVRQAVVDATRNTLEELGHEISLCLRYYSVTFRGQRPARVRLVGGESYDPHLQAVLKAAVTIPVEPARPLYSVNTSRMKPADRRGTLGEWTMAFGLSLKLIEGYFGPRDGKPRESLNPISGSPSTEVVDLDYVAGGGADMESSGAPATARGPLRMAQEVSHA